MSAVGTYNSEVLERSEIVFLRTLSSWTLDRASIRPFRRKNNRAPFAISAQPMACVTSYIGLEA
jgi:hypothetical protein